MQGDTEKKVRKHGDDPAGAPYNRKKALGTALLKWLECEFFGGFIFMSLLATRVMLHSAGDVIFGLLGFVCYAVVLADIGLKEGSRAHVKNEVRGDSVKPGFGYLLGITAVSPAILSFVLLLLSYSGVIGSAVLPFKALNAGLWGAIDLFAADMDIANVHPALFAVYPALQLLLAAVVGVTFGMGLKNEDIKTKIMYKDRG